MTRKIIKRLLDTYDNDLKDDNTLAIEYEECTVKLTENEIALLTKAQKDDSIDKRIRDYIKKAYKPFLSWTNGE